MNPVKQILKSLLGCMLRRDEFLLRGPQGAATDRIDIALTFDDGPNPEHTPQVLDALADAGWQATFFVIGEQAERHPDLLRRMVDEGHLIGNHTWSHGEPHSVTTEQFLEEVERTRQFIEQLTGESPRFVRPPKGALTYGKLQGLRHREEATTLWNVDPKDFQMTDGKTLCRWTATYHPRGGDIVLLHDRLPWAGLAVRELAARHRKDLKSVRLDEWVTPRDTVRDNVPAEST